MNNTSNNVQDPLNIRSSIESITLSVSLALIIAFSVFGNFLLIISFLKNKRLRASFANKLILSLAVADFTTASFPMSYQLATILNVKIISNGGVICTIGGLASYSFFFTSTFTMVMLCIDRFVALGYPLQYNLRMTSKVKIFMITYPWIHGALFFILCGSILEVKFDRKGLDCGLSWSERPMVFTLSILLIHVGIPFVLLLVLNTWTLCLVRAQNRQILNYDKRELTQNSAARIRTKAAFKKRGEFITLFVVPKCVFLRLETESIFY
jgi:hypothetical protein